MQFIKSLFLITFFFTCSFAKLLHIDDSVINTSLMPYITFYKDYGKKYDINTIQNIDEKFEHTNKELLSMGFNNDAIIWTKIELKNETDKELTRFIEFSPSYVTEKSVFDCTFKCKKIEAFQKDYFLNPLYKISLNPLEMKKIYILASSNGTGLKTKLGLKDKKVAFEEARKLYQVYYLFLGAMIALLLYNLFLYFFSKELSYIYYCLYLASMAFHQFLFVGLGPIVLGQTFIEYFNKVSILSPTSFVFFMSIFVNSFFNMKLTHKKIFLFIRAYQIILLLGVFVCLIDNSWLNLVMLVGTIGILGVLILVYYLLFKGNIFARFFVGGWSLVVFSIVMMELQNGGHYKIFVLFPYIIEFSVFVEAILFSLALAYKLKLYREEKDRVNDQLIEQQMSETKRLESEVQERTKELQNSLDERELLMRELNHRVKNNMQLIISLLRLQANSEEDEKLISSLQVVEHRIQAMSHLHELLYAQETLTHVNMQEYITNMSKELSKNFDPTKNIKTVLHVKGELPLKQAVYVGLILNEMLTNAYKYAFENTGEIEIKFTCKEEKVSLYVKDNGKGFNEDKISPTSLGMSVIKTLIEKQLEGCYELKSKVGTAWRVEFVI